MSIPSKANRSNNKVNIPPMKSSSKKQDAQRYMNYDPEKEPIKAYLRIRPLPTNYQKSIEEPYITVLDNTEILMTPPSDSNAYRSRHREPEKYRFTHIFQDTTQQEFYNETTLDLVKDVLYGNDALIFAYGVTNSGKTYTVMGNEEEDQLGILPRTLSTIFSSIENYKSETKLKPYMHSLLQPYDQVTEENRHILDLCNLRSIPQVGKRIDIEPHFEYGVWVSFVEIYNEQVFDLLDITKSPKRKQLQLKYEQRTGNKYVADTQLVKVKSMEEADAIMRLGQQNRQVFSTLMNQASSRSHSVFTIHIIRCPIDKDNYVIEDPQYAHMSRFSVVDLAGSERYRNTNSTGQRLKEAGNINKSLMVLGQCMEVLRINQIKMGKQPTPVPFRHSKLTELFKSTFEGHGKAAIIVNVNPNDTGFDENIHVMRFAAVAKDIKTWRQIQPKLDLQDIQPTVKRLRCGTEEEEEEDVLVDGLIAQLEEIWEKWMEAESRATNLEFEIREQVARETDAELKKMEDMYLLALRREAEQLSKENQNATVLERQKTILEELDNLKSIIDGYNVNKQTMQDRIIELEKQNKKERERSEYLVAQLQKYTKPSEDEEELLKEEEGPKFDEKYNVFLDLRKQLRRSIFKKEELSKDADIILTQVEQFEGVSFKLAKETKMGKLLKLIAQEDFEKDPYMIRNRALRLFKKYAQLPTNDVADQSTQQAFSSMQLSESDTDSLRAENTKLKQKIRALTKGQKRLKQAFEKMKPSSLLLEDYITKEDTSMKDVDSQASDNVASVIEDEEDDYESDITELLKPHQRQKRRRKLRETNLNQ